MVCALLPVTAWGARKDTWLKVSTPEFTVITSLSESEAKAWAGEFAQYVAALRTLLDEKRPLPPLTILLFARENDFNRFRPLNKQGKPEDVAGFFLRYESWAVAAMAGVSQPAEVRRTVFHEGVHWFLSVTGRPNPVWLEEGIAEVFSTLEVKPADMLWGRPVREHVALLNTHPLLPFEELVNLGHGDLFNDESRRTNIVYAESWAAVHFLRFGQHDLPRDGLSRFVAALQKGASQAEAFRGAFGKTYAEMDVLLRRYTRDVQYFVRHAELIPVPEAKPEPASILEVEDAMARLALATRHFDDATAHAQAAIAAAPDSPRGHEVLALVHRQKEEADAATAEFKLAIERGTRDFLAFFEVANAIQHEDGSLRSDTLAPAKARQIADYYERAIELYPQFSLSYENLAGMIGMVERWEPKDREFLERGAALFPNEPLIRVGLAILTHRRGDVATARATLAEILRDPELKRSTRNYAEQFAETWEREATLKEIEQLAAARKFTEALALVDRTLAGEIDAGLRQQLNDFRNGLSYNQRAAKLDAALQDGRYAEARRIGHEILESNVAPNLKTPIRRTLDELDRRKLGLETDAAK